MSDIPDPSTQHKSVIRPNLDNSVVDDDSKVERLNSGLARRLQDVEQAQLSDLRVGLNTRRKRCRRARVGAVNDEGFVGEF